MWSVFRSDMGLFCLQLLASFLTTIITLVATGAFRNDASSVVPHRYHRSSYFCSTEQRREAT